MNRYVRYAILLVAVVLLMGLCLPKQRLLKNISFSKLVYDSESELMRFTLSADDKYRHYKELGSLSPYIIRGTILHEDRYFYRHLGVNPFSLLRAAWQTYVVGGRKIGGSTITMQLARILYDINSRTPAGKMIQILRALQLEILYSKDDILEAYLNLAPYGGNIEGVGAASLIYFKRDAGKITLVEALTLSVIPQSPERRAGNDDMDRRYLLNARNELFSKWNRSCPGEEVEEALFSLPVEMHTPSDLPFLAPHFTNEMVRDETSGNVIRTTLDMALQRLIERKASQYIESKRAIGIQNVAAMLVDHRDMKVRAVLGSVDFFNNDIQGQVNGTKAKRSPGSALKPFIYALGLEQGLIHPLTMLKDSPSSFYGYNPENFDGDFAGPVKVRDALIRSRNVPAVDVASRLKGPTLHEFLRRAQISGLKGETYYGLSLVLGSAEVTMGELVMMYAMLANRGVMKTLRTSEDQREEWERRMLSEEAAFLIMDILRNNPRPDQQFNEQLLRDRLRVAWKTGTSFAFRDAWSIGIFGPYVLAVWVGNFDGESNPYFIGRDAAAPLFFQIVDAVKSVDHGVLSFKDRGLADLNISRVEVCALSGKLPGPHCKNTVETWFMPGISPISRCDIHRQVAVNPKSGLDECAVNDHTGNSKIYEYWPSDLLRLFEKAGIPRQVPPPPDKKCTFDTIARQGKAPKIMSPQKKVVYSKRTGSRSRDEIAFLAVTDADAHEVFWFLDEQYLGKANSTAPFYWDPHPGSYIVRAVDDHGRADSRKVNVEVVK